MSARPRHILSLWRQEGGGPVGELRAASMTVGELDAAMATICQAQEFPQPDYCKPLAGPVRRSPRGHVA